MQERRCKIMKKTEVEEQNKALVKRYIEAWNKGDFEALVEMHAYTITDHSSMVLLSDD